jgi:hypothetical protein
MGHGMEMVHKNSEEYLTVCPVKQWHAPGKNGAKAGCPPVMTSGRRL